MLWAAVRNVANEKEWNWPAQEEGWGRSPLTRRVATYLFNYRVCSISTSAAAPSSCDSETGITPLGTVCRQPTVGQVKPLSGSSQRGSSQSRSFLRSSHDKVEIALRNFQRCFVARTECRTRRRVRRGWDNDGSGKERLKTRQRSFRWNQYKFYGMMPQKLS